MSRGIRSSSVCLLTCLMLLGVGAASVQANSNLIYDAITGTVTIDPAEGPGGVLTGYVLQSDGDFLFANHTPVLGGTLTQTANELSEANPFGPKSGLQILGEVLPSGLSLAGLQNVLTAATYTGQIGTGVHNFDLVVLPIPEPAIATTALALAACVVGRRSRRRTAEAPQH